LALLDFFWFCRRRRERMAKYVRFDESAAEAVAVAPAVRVTAHFGNWELLGQVSAWRGGAQTSVALEGKHGVADRLLRRVRGATGQELVPVRGALRALIKTLRHGGAVALVLDRNTLPEDGGLFVDFFGLPVTMSNAASVLALRLNVPVILGLCAAQADGTYRVYARPVPADGATGPDEVTRRIAAMLEEEIRKDPAQWVWMYKRWKFRAPGTDPGRYPFYAREPRAKDRLGKENQ